MAFVVAAAVTAGAGLACSRTGPPLPATTSTSTATPSQATATVPAAADPPAALVQVHETAENLFDSAHAKNWFAAAERLQALLRADEQIPTNIKKADLVAQLRVHVKGLVRHVAARQQVPTMDDANAITRLAAELSGQYRTTVPYEIAMLDYFGRQLEIGIAARNRTTLARATADLRQTWNQFEPVIVRRGHADDARRFTDIVVTLEGARRPSDYVAPARAELDAVDRLEAIFAPSK